MVYIMDQPKPKEQAISVKFEELLEELIGLVTVSSSKL